jgi:fido (protein-threonine AMPylation protein)
VIVYELTGSEDHPAYQELEISNGNRQYDFLRSMVSASINLGRPFLSQQLLKALNFQAIACLYTHAGEYRPCPVTVGDYLPPDHYRVQAQMDDFINMVNRRWEESDDVVLSSYVLWRLNSIHPFINGNGRTARAACYLVLCIKAGGWLPGQTILPELLKKNRPEYVAALKHADASAAVGKLDLSFLHALVSKLLESQLQDANIGMPPSNVS